MRWDEPFTIHDIQFNNPQIGVPHRSGFKVFTELLWIFSILNFGANPDPAFFQVRHLLEQPRIRTLFGQDGKDCPGFRFTFVQDRCKSTRGLDRADHARHFKVSGQARGQAASFSIEFDSNP